MTSPDSPQLNRRELLRNGSLALSLGALLAACGAGRTGSDAPGRLGLEDLPDEPSRDTTVDDAVLLRTLQSLEHTAVELHNRLLDMGAFGGAAAVAERFVADHEGHSAAIGALVTAAGGEPHACPNTFVMERAVEPVLAAIEDSDDAERDALNTAHAFESLLGAAYQDIVARIDDGALRAAAMAVGGDEHRHAAVLALAINPDPVAPEMIGEAAPAGGEFVTPYAIPSTFGPLTGIELVVGAPSGDDQQRLDVILQTPAENTFVYNDLSC